MTIEKKSTMLRMHPRSASSALEGYSRSQSYMLEFRYDSWSSMPWISLRRSLRNSIAETNTPPAAHCDES